MRASSGHTEIDHRRTAEIAALDEGIRAMREMLRTGVIPEFRYDGHLAKRN